MGRSRGGCQIEPGSGKGSDMTGNDERDARPRAMEAAAVAPRRKPSAYPETFARRVAGREKRALGEVFGLMNFGVNLTRLAPGAWSALLHRHSRQDEFVYILEGAPTLVTEEGETKLAPGMCAGFPAGGVAHHLVNRTDTDALYLEIGDRTPGDSAAYPADDLEARLGPDGGWRFFHKDGRSY
jgi:uncharacterized cupin superfamily protein